jgi:phosphoglycolate phosphatase-like HAD superfamily hydrolase
LKERRLVFWDFDGVIKESVVVKTEAYVGLFAPFGPEVAARVREHHERNGGMSRFEKIPLYLTWVGMPPTYDAVATYCQSFSASVEKAVVASAWVRGAREYLEANHIRQRFVVATATPQDEIERILGVLRIRRYFREVLGAPTDKAEAVASVLRRWACPTADALMIGDSQSDYAAAAVNGVDFLLRQTPFNLALQRSYVGPQCRDFGDQSAIDDGEVE